jgi:hypothetical protein
VYLEPVFKGLKENKSIKKKILLSITDQLVNISTLQSSYRKALLICLVKHWIKKVVFGQKWVKTSILEANPIGFNFLLIYVRCLILVVR